MMVTLWNIIITGSRVKAVVRHSVRARHSRRANVPMDCPQSTCLVGRREGGNGMWCCCRHSHSPVVYGERGRQLCDGPVSALHHQPTYLLHSGRSDHPWSASDVCGQRTTVLRARHHLAADLSTQHAFIMSFPRIFLSAGNPHTHTYSIASHFTRCTSYEKNALVRRDAFLKC